MNKIIIGLCVTLAGAVAIAAQQETVGNEVQAALDGFNAAYATNDADTYFDYYADDATVFFSGARQDMAAYEEEWNALIDSGNGVVLNELSDVVIQVMPGGEVAISTYFVHVKTRYGDVVEELKAFETDVWNKFDGEWKVVSLHYTELAAE